MLKSLLKFFFLNNDNCELIKRMGYNKCAISISYQSKYLSSKTSKFKNRKQRKNLSKYLSVWLILNIINDNN